MEIDQHQSGEPVKPAFTIQKEGLPGILGVLTILTIIGSVFSLISAFFTGIGCKVLEMDSVTDKMNPNDLAFLQATCEHQTILMLSAIIGGALCLVAALMMRKLKQQGFVIYIVGQILPLIISLIVMGEYMFKSWKNYSGIVLVLLFIGLYASQRKHLTQ